MENNFIYEQTVDVIKQEGTLLYLTLVGSRLFGTELPESDYDVKGIYLPSLKNIFLGNYKSQIRFKDEGCDLDVTVFSLQSFIKHVKKLDINSIDMLFSKSNKDAVIYSDGILFNKYFTVENIQKHILTNKMPSFIGYTYTQLDKYNVKISRLNEVLELKKDIENIIERHEHSSNLRLIDIIDKIDFSKFSYISKKISHLTESLSIDAHDNMMAVLTKLFPYNAKVDYVLNGLNSIKNSYGKRVFKNLNSADFKSLSHAYRSVYELYCLLTKGEILFPLDVSDYLLDVRKGKFKVDKVVESILDMINEVKKIEPNFNNEINVLFLEDIILDYCWKGV